MAKRWVTFDCYGTLIDWERGIMQSFARLWPDADASALLARYHEIEPQVQQGSNAPYTVVLGEVLARITELETLPLPHDEADALGRSLPNWPPFDEVPDALRAIRANGWKTAILSNTDPELLAQSVARLGVEFDMCITVAEARSYKPAPGHWERFFEQSGASRDAHVHVGASVFHDIEPAAALGLHAVWINRAGGESDAPRDAELPDLTDLPRVLDGIVHG